MDWCWTDFRESSGRTSRCGFMGIFLSFCNNDNYYDFCDLSTDCQISTEIGSNIVSPKAGRQLGTALRQVFDRDAQTESGQDVGLEIVKIGQKERMRSLP